MEKMELYHIHKIGDHDKNWHESALIEVKENFKNTMYKRYQDFTTALPIEGGGSINLYDFILMLQYSNQLNEKKIKDIIDYSYRISFNANSFKRETVLENYRKDNTSTKPSRLHSIYMTDEKGIDSWITKLGVENIELFRVEAEGNIFKTNEIFIPDETLSYEKAYDKSYYYWNPNFKKAPIDSNEYLVQGKVKVLEKIKTINMK